MINRLGLLLGAFLISAQLWAGATFSRIKNWTDLEILYSADLNAEFNNILNNLLPSGIDDYSANTTEMRDTEDPYPGSSESLATSLQGELERMRYQILEIKKSMQASNITYWYQDLPTAGVFTIAGSSVGVNDTTPDYYFDVEGGTSSFSGNILADGNISTTGDDVDISTHVNIVGTLTLGSTFEPNTLTVTSTTTFSGMTRTAFYYNTYTAPATDLSAYTVTGWTEITDRLNEFDGTTFTAGTTGFYQFTGYIKFSANTGDMDFVSARFRVNGSDVNPGYVSHDPATGDGIPVPLCATLSLTAGDTVVIRLSGSTTAGANWGPDIGSSMTIIKLP